MNSCSSLVALSNAFRACSSLTRLEISLRGQERGGVGSGHAHSPSPTPKMAAQVTHRTFWSDLGRMKMAMGWS